jgi:chromosome segregation ATPase
MAEALQADITENGLNQGDLVKFLKNVRDTVNELVDDHATYKTQADAVETLVEELHDDHATNKTVIDELKTDYTALLADVTAIRAEVVKLVTDMASRISDHNTLRTKLNADAGVTDADYAAAAAITAAAPAALTATAGRAVRLHRPDPAADLIRSQKEPPQ